MYRSSSDFTGRWVISTQATFIAISWQYFENAIKISSGKNLSTKVEYARGYARPLYDRKLHDRLLNDVVSANPRVLGYTLTNVLAQREAKELLSSADDYF